MRILAVEDDRINQVVLNTLFKQLAVEAEVVATGTEALATLKVRHGDFSAVLMDLGLPDAEGTDIVRQLRVWELQEGKPHLFVCALTGHNTPEKRALCLKAGMDGFLAKPILLKELAQALGRV